MQNQSHVGNIPEVKNKQHKPVVIQASTENISTTTVLTSRPPRRSKRLREKASGYILGDSKENEASMCFPIKKKKSFSCGKIPHSKELVKAPPPSNFDAAEEDEIKSHYYKDVKVTIEGFGEKWTIYNSAGGGQLLHCNTTRFTSTQDGSIR